MGVELTFDTREADEVLSALLKMTDDLTPAMKRIGEHMMDSTEKTFRAGGRPESWPELAPSTMMSRMGGSKKVFTKKGSFRASAARKFGRIKPLLATGRLLRSITYQAGRDNVRWGTNVIYGAIHQFGGMAGRGKKVTIPARPYLQWLPEDAEEASRILVDYVLSGRNRK